MKIVYSNYRYDPEYYNQWLRMANFELLRAQLKGESTT